MLLAAGALVRHPAGFVPIAAAMGALSLAEVLVDARLQDSIGGSARATVTSVAPLHAPFRAPYTVARGLPINPGEDLRIPVTFTPARNGTFIGVYRLTWTDRFGPHTLDVSLTGTGAK